MRQFSLRVLCVLMMAMAIVSMHAQTVWDGTASAQWSGSGTEADPYLITNAKQLAGLAKRVNAGNNYGGKYFKLTADILLNDTTNWHNWEHQAPANSWTPIGDYNATTPTAFYGMFDGDGHIIAGLYSKNYNNGRGTAWDTYVGLFGKAETTVKNLHIRASFIATDNTTFVGLLGGTITYPDNCSVNGKVIAIDDCQYVGGLAGTGEGCNNCQAYVDIQTNHTGQYLYCGGLMGSLGESFSNCSSSGTIIATRSSTNIDARYYSMHVGGITGRLGCSTSSRKGTSGSSVNTTIEATQVGSIYAGGIVGNSSGCRDGNYVEKCYSFGNIAIYTGEEVYEIYAGSIAGHGDILDNCFATGNLSIEARSTTNNCNIHAGGLCGTGTSKNSYYTQGKIYTMTKMGNIYAGGLVGDITADNITNSYYNVETSGIADNDNLWAKTTQELKTKLTYNDWEFESVWGRDNSINNGYPYLRWSQTEQVDALDLAVTWEGTGTEKDPYQIGTAEQWRGFVKSLNGNTFVHKYITLTNDIFLNDTTGWRDWEFNEPANTDSPAGTDNNSFRGHFDGAGHTIYGLYIKRDKATHAGLFGVARPGATVKQVRLDASHIEINATNGETNVGGLVGRISDTQKEYALSNDTIQISECAVNAFLYGNSSSAHVGGLVGVAVMPTQIQDCYVHGIVSGWNGSAGGAFGAISNNSGSSQTYSIHNCYIAALIDGNGRYSKQGIIGSQYGNHVKIDVKNCYFDQEVSLQTAENYGALPKLTAEMKRAATYENWDFTHTWGRRSNINNGYPYLRCFEGKNLLNEVEGLTLDQHELVLPIDTTDVTLTATILPENHERAVCVWSSDNNAVVTVADGMLLPQAAGETMVRVRTADGHFTDSCKVTVFVPVESIVLDHQSLTLPLNTTFQLNATIAPENATNQNVTWKSSSTSYATVTAEGLVTTQGRTGTVKIIVTTEEKNLRDTCEITIVRPVTGVKISKTTLALVKGKTATLSATVSPTNATNKKVIWSNRHPEVTTVSETGLVTAVGGGNDTILVTTEDGGFTDSCIVTVTVPVTSVSLNETNLQLRKGETYTLQHTILPADATNQQVTYSSSNASIVSVTDEGVLTALSNGSVTITVTTADGGKTATCRVTVPVDVMSVSLDSKTLPLAVGATQRLYATIYPYNATITDVVWSNTNPAVASVDQLGYVKALAAGTDTVIVTTKDGGFADSCIVTVSVPVTSVSFPVAEVHLCVGETYQLQATVLPENATNKNVTYTMYTGTSFASVTSDGLVTALRSGTARVRVTTEDKNKTAYCNIIVTNPVKDITLNYENILLEVGGRQRLLATINPTDADNREVIWTTSNSAIVALEDMSGSYNQYVYARAAAEGTAMVIASSADGTNLSDTCYVTVKAKTIYVSGVQINGYSSNQMITLDLNSTKQFAATISPSNATNKHITWSTSNNDVVTITADGLARAVGVGSATITVTTQDGDYTASVNINVPKPIVHVSHVTLSKTELSLTTNKDNTHQLTATIFPADADNQSVTWRSSNAQVATVSATGLVTAVGNGTADITVTTKDGNHTATCKVTVTTLVQGISLNHSTLDMFVGATEQLTASILPTTASNQVVTWSSNNTQVATVENGLIKAIGNGTATITATSADGSFTAACDITVTTPVSGVTLNQTTLALEVTETFQLDATVKPATASNPTITWTTSNAQVATVVNGLVTAIGNGTADITVTTADGHYTAICAVTVTTAVQGISLNHSTLDMFVGATEQLTASILPTTASNQVVTWSSNNTQVATVENGLIKAIGNGTATITVTTVDGNYSASCIVTVTTPIIPVTSIVLEQSVITLEPGKSKKLVATVLPENATNKTITWSSANTAVAEIAGEWLIAIAEGETTITATAENGGVTATCKVIVGIPVEGITLNETELTMQPGNAKQLIATITPANASNQNYTLVSDNEAVVMVTTNGWIIANAVGTANITATTEDGGYTAVCKVTVQDDTSTNLDIHPVDNVQTTKLLENGTIYILRNGEKYTIDGRKVE